jgi:hypothetical protein
METIIVEISLQLIAEVDKYETVLLRCQSTNSHVTSSPVSPSLAAPRRTPLRNSPSIPRHDTHQGIPIPRPQRHNAMYSIGSGGPAGTRTSGRWIRQPARVHESSCPVVTLDCGVNPKGTAQSTGK